MSSEATQFLDEFHNVHERGTELGRGGQGVVFRTRDPDIAVKLALDGDGRPITHAGYVEKLRRVRTLPVPAGLHLAAPMAVLQETAGYAMRLLDDMEPFAAFWSAPSEDAVAARPQWLSSLPEELAQALLGYRDSGGLHRRLIALYKCAAVLARLHGAGLLYGDVSPANAFISRDHGSREVWLIDADNLRYETPGRGSGVYTPRFGAPELVQGLDGARPRTDCHAFAVMAFEMLTCLHPFIGAYVEGGGRGDWSDDGTAQDVDEQAYAGHVPWIQDADDPCNRKDNGLIELVLTSELKRLFQETFGPGRTKPWLRPSMFHWPPALARAADEVITCPGCRMGYYFDPDSASQLCPCCEEARPPVLAVTAYDWVGRPVESQQPAWRFVRAWGSAVPGTLPHRLFYPFSVTEGDRDVLEISKEGDELRLSGGDAGHTHRFSVAGAPEADCLFTEFAGTAALPLALAKRGFWLRVDGPHPRVVRCALHGRTR